MPKYIATAPGFFDGVYRKKGAEIETPGEIKPCSWLEKVKEKAKKGKKGKKGKVEKESTEGFEFDNSDEESNEESNEESENDTTATEVETL
jgi:hypothetical protein